MEPGAPATGRPVRGPRRLLQLLLAMLLVALVVGGAVPYVSGAGRAYLSYLVLAERQDAEGASLAAAEARAAGGRVVQGYPQIGAVLAYASGGFAQRLRERPGIAAVGATRTATVPSPPGPLAGADFRPGNEAAAAADTAQGSLSDPAEQDDWNLAMIGAGDPPSASDALLRTAADRAAAASAPTAAALRGVLVAVLDSGVDDTHPDLRDAVDPQASVSCADGRPDARYGAWRPDEGVSESGHGTHVAGIVGAARDGRGVTGVAPGVRIAAVRLLGPLGQYYAENIVCGMLWAADHGARAINDSYFADPWKYNCPEDPDQAAITQAVARAVSYAQKRGSVVVASAGNDGQDLAADRDDLRSPNDRTSGPPQDRHLGTECIRLPGELPGVVTVSAVDRSGVPAGYTNYGGVTIAAPGGDPDGGVDGAIVSDWPGDRYAALAGTSMAAAHVTGAVAVVAAEHPGWGAGRITDELESAAAANCPTGPDTCGDRRFFGAGLLALP
ncbi:S8 family peptidase [Kitasatospora sp. DSM 101779]|uniref:S8 family peptidase n=1 Tax=Kitasatospora sp. DSM 101779 TaxID=2853165 RepID=UPI0021DB16C1|nr:S8 family serine peptidase [Kitasatospora sp. DSM 101779]MCU7822604.1 S8 family serine peptidase [Kitasatospora sp. DSM 101779]